MSAVLAEGRVCVGASTRVRARVVTEWGDIGPRVEGRFDEGRREEGKGRSRTHANGHAKARRMNASLLDMPICGQTQVALSNMDI